MSNRKWTVAAAGVIAIAGMLGGAPWLLAQKAKPVAEAQSLGSAATSIHWQTAAQRDRSFPLFKERGTLILSDQGVEFNSANGRKLQWTALDIQTFSIAPHKLVLHTYLKRSLPLTGDETNEFVLTDAAPSTVASWLAAYLKRPSQNSVPAAEVQSLAVIPVHHRTLSGGTNGTLRFHSDGIDYVTSTAGDSRSWRWEDLQTLAEPDSYHLYLFGYRDTYTFDLKEPLARAVYDRAVETLSSHIENQPVHVVEKSTSTENLK